MFDVEAFVKETVKEIAEQVGKGKAVTAVSGGVDSITTAVLAHRALGDQLTAVFLDDGLMREGEPESVVDLLRSWGVKAELYDVKKEFFKALKNLQDAEEKRKAFRGTFYRVLGEILKKEKADFLIQGTIAADVVETVKGIKTQHNILEQIGIDPSEFGIKGVIEPLRELYKPEVRMVARALDLPDDVSERMPFPGPGLAVRIVGTVTPEKVEIVRKATEIVEEEIEKANLKPFQAFAVLLPGKATGVKGDKRVYGNMVVVRIVSSEDAMTADVLKVPYGVIEQIQARITSEIPEISRVLYDVTPKPPSTIEFE